MAVVGQDFRKEQGSLRHRKQGKHSVDAWARFRSRLPNHSHISFFTSTPYHSTHIHGNFFMVNNLSRHFNSSTCVLIKIKSNMQPTSCAH